MYNTDRVVFVGAILLIIGAAIGDTIFGSASIHIQRVNLIGILLLIMGCIMVYGSKYIIKLFGWNFDDMKTVKFKLLGLTVAIIGILKIFGVI